MMRYRVVADAACASLDDGAVVLDVGTKRYYSLNETGAIVWQLMEGGATVAAMATHLAERYRVEADVAERAIDALLAQLVDEGLVARLDE